MLSQTDYDKLNAAVKNIGLLANSINCNALDGVHKTLTQIQLDVSAVATANAPTAAPPPQP